MGKKPTYAELEKELKNLKRAYAQYRRRHQNIKTVKDGIKDFNKSYIANMQSEIEQLHSDNVELQKRHRELLNKSFGIEKKWWQIF